MKPNNHLWTDLSALSFLCFLSRVPWLFLVPTTDAPDEVSHLWVVKFLIEHARLPTHTDVLASSAQAVYGPLPQIGYLPHVIISKSLPFWSVAVTGRLGSLVMGLCLIWIAYLLGRELYPANRLAWLALPVIVLFHPQIVFLNAYTNSDSTATAASSLMLLLVVWMIRRGLMLWACSAVGLLAGVATLSKYAALSVVAASTFGLLLAGWLNGASWQMIIAAAGLMVSTFALASNWWFVRELHEYPGDLLGTKTMRHIWAVDTKHTIDYKTSYAFLFTKRWWRFTYFSYWAYFGYLTVKIWQPFYFVYMASQIAAIAGGITKFKHVEKFFSILKVKLRVKDLQDIPEDNMDYLKYAAIYTTFFLSIAINLAAMFWSSSQNLGDAQGRYLFANELPIIALTISGLSALSKKYGNRLVTAFAIFNFIVYLDGFIILYQRYGGFAFKP